MRKLIVIATLAVLMVMTMATMAFANHGTAALNTTGASDPAASAYNPNMGVDNWGDRDRTPAGGYSAIGCSTCHGAEWTVTAGGGTAGVSKTGGAHASRGPHGGYTATTNNCQTCHRVHLGENASLLPGATVVSVCNYCHDLTGSEQGPYNMLNTTGTTAVKAAHRITGLYVYANETDSTDNFNGSGVPTGLGQNTYSPSLPNWTDATDSNWAAAATGAYNIIPGGDPATGGNIAIVQGNQGQLSGANFTCDSCHTPHAVKGSAVIPYLGDSHIKSSVSTLYPGSVTATDAPQGNEAAGVEAASFTMTNRLLKVNVNGNAIASQKYGSEWCMGCHAGREGGAMGTKFNHPVNGTGDGYYYLDAAFIAAANVTLDPDIPTLNTQDDPYKFTAIIKGGTGIADPAVAGVDDIYKTYNGRATSYYSAFKPNLAIPGDLRSNKMFALTSNPGVDVDPITLAVNADSTMDYDDAALAGGPSCQQCHGNARDVEKAFADESASGGHPHNMTFPHLSTNKALLTETGDDFCTNCHGLNLP